MVPELALKNTDDGRVPEGDGWYVLNARDARWWQRQGLGRWCHLDSEPPFPQLGVRIGVLRPGEPNGMYHRESGQEDFLVVSGECTAIIEGEERRLRAWDFVHCPPMTDHIFVGGGDGPCVVVTVGARTPEDEIVYPVNDVAAKSGASVDAETASVGEAYARYPREPWFFRYRDGDLPHL
jgi:uncharacterized cupin superfamily protein